MSQTIGPVTTQKGPVCFAGGVGPVYGPGTQSFVLDQLSAFPAVAYSVRQLTANPLYVRPYCMLVRRDSDNATLNIGYVNGILDIVSLLAFCGSGNGYVVTWYNQGSLGSSADAQQSTAANQPQICAAGVVETQNGVPSVYFGGSQYLATSGNTGTTGTQPSTILGVASFTGTGYRDFSGYGPAGNGQSRYAGIVNGLAGAGVNGADVSGGTNTVNTLYITEAIFNSQNITVYKNGGTVVSGNVTFSTTAAPILVGAGLYTAINPMAGNISEVIHFFNVAITASDQKTYDLNTASFFSIPGVTQ